MPFLRIFHVLKVHLIKICKIQPPNLLFILVFVLLIDFRLADLIFHKFLELHPTLFGKKISVLNFPFLWPKSAKCDESFLSMLP